jgi:hypothetical protein
MSRDTFIRHGYTFRLEIEPDTEAGPPWTECEGHGPVSEWTTREKRPGERILASDRSHKRYYDVEAAMQLARRDGWGTHDGRQPGESTRAYAARAVEADYQFLRGWARDAWQYVGVVVTLIEAGRPTTERESLWGIESDAEAYLQKVARELAEEILTRLEVEQPDAQLSEN